MRAALKRITPLRSLYHFLLTVYQVARAHPGLVAQEYDTQFVSQADPWNYAGGEHQARYRCALEIVDRQIIGRVLAGNNETKILEIGCGEGLFTEQLVTRSVRVVATDTSPTALARARTRLDGHQNIEFRLLDILTDPIEEKFDLIVIDHVIDLFSHRSAYRTTAEKVAQALAADGVALVGTMRAFELAEKAWWSPLLVHGGVAILDSVGRHTALSPIETVTESFYTYTLFRHRG
jgi:2-polyprenyl-3-methyl-5-hydroxy-6-metoxy-1,4-benzoquinol methylase